jgi:hypothetical protein
MMILTPDMSDSHGVNAEVLCSPLNLDARNLMEATRDEEMRILDFAHERQDLMGMGFL